MDGAKLCTPADVIEAVLREEHLCGEARRVARLVAERLAGVLRQAEVKGVAVMIRPREDGDLEWVGVRSV